MAFSRKLKCVALAELVTISFRRSPLSNVKKFSAVNLVAKVSFVSFSLILVARSSQLENIIDNYTQQQYRKN